MFGSVTSSQNKKLLYTDAGLGTVMVKSQKMRNFRELAEVNEQIKDLQQKDSGWRSFVEFKAIQDGEVIITIEYW
jgi:hypothetical protein